MFRRAAAGIRLAVGGAAAAATCTARATRCPPRATEDSILLITERNWGPDWGLWSATWDVQKQSAGREMFTSLGDRSATAGL